MSENSNTICPECGTLQESETPFCDNCGFRLGRPETAPEGHRSIPRLARLQAAQTDVELEAIPAIKTDRHAVQTAVEGVEAVPRAIAEAARTDRTEVEGLPAVVGKAVSPPTERHPPITGSLGNEDTNAESDADPADVPIVVEREFRASPAVLGVLWLVSLVAVAMVAGYVAETPEESAIQQQGVQPVARTRIGIPEGTFKWGLNERVRSFILSTCLKMADDRSMCEQDQLLAGEFPEKEVNLGAFSIDALEVTVGEYQRCVDADACAIVDWKNCKVYTHQGLQVSLRVPRSFLDSGVAVTCVTPEEATDYCAWRSGRLPSHDEWERAARGTDGRLFPWGSVWDPLAANWGEVDVVRVAVLGKIDGFEGIAPPGQFAAGLSPTTTHDMAGNAAEWVAGDPPTARGGSWVSSPFDLRATGRLELGAGARRTDVGFRCAYDL